MTQDTQRESGNLRPADDATTIWTDGMSEEDVLQRLIQVVQQKRGAAMESAARNQSATMESNPSNTTSAP